MNEQGEKINRQDRSREFQSSATKRAFGNDKKQNRLIDYGQRMTQNRHENLSFPEEKI